MRLFNLLAAQKSFHYYWRQEKREEIGAVREMKGFPRALYAAVSSFSAAKTQVMRRTTIFSYFLLSVRLMTVSLWRRMKKNLSAA